MISCPRVLRPTTLDPIWGPTVSFPGANGSTCGKTLRRADVAQLVEQLFCKQQVPGSSPVVGSKCRSRCRVHHQAAASPTPAQWVG
jgi:hypothetical protein